MTNFQIITTSTDANEIIEAAFNEAKEMKAGNLEYFALGYLAQALASKAMFPKLFDNGEAA